MTSEQPQPDLVKAIEDFNNLTSWILGMAEMHNQLVLDFNHLKARVYKLETELESP